MIFKKILLLFLSCVLISCSSVVNVRSGKNFNHYSYTVGKNESVHFILFPTIDDETDKLLSSEHRPIILSLNLEDGTKLLDEELFKFSCETFYTSLTCLKSFDGNLKISEIVYDWDSVILTCPTDISLTFDNGYALKPSFPIGYKTPYEITSNHRAFYIGETAICFDSKGYFYVFFGPIHLNVKRGESYFINGVSSNNSIFTISNIGHSNFEEANQRPEYETLEYFPLDHPINVPDFLNGVFIKFKINPLYDEWRLIGSDVYFDITINGDNYNVPLHIASNRSSWH
ncbi:MAG: hypothetical protein RSB95_04440 [Bacilli bacterium]